MNLVYKNYQYLQTVTLLNSEFIEKPDN